MPDHKKKDLSVLVPRASKDAIDLMEWMLKYNPRDRPKAHEVLTHEFFAGKVRSNLPTVLSSKDG